MLIDYNLYNDIERVDLTIDNSGRAESFPIIEITFIAPASSYKITNQDGKFIRVVKNFLTNEKLVINCEVQSVELDGISILKNLDLASRFYKIKSGENIFSFEPNGVARINFKFIPRYL